jgi:hypothetical protein
MPLRLPILLGHRHEFIVELCVDLRSELLGHHFINLAIRISLVIPNVVRDLESAGSGTISRSK